MPPMKPPISSLMLDNFTAFYLAVEIPTVHLQRTFTATRTSEQLNGPNSFSGQGEFARDCISGGLQSRRLDQCIEETRCSSRGCEISLGGLIHRVQEFSASRGARALPTLIP